MKSEYIGILLSKKKFKQIPIAKGKLKKILSLYEEAAEKYDVTLCFFSIKNIVLDEKKVAGFIKEENGYTLKTIPIPSVIYRRIGCSEKNKIIAALLNDGTKIFNPSSISNKYHYHQLLSKNKELSQYLPTTYIATQDTVKMMMNRFNCLLIKPNVGSFGRGIMKLEKMDEGWCLFIKGRSSKKRWVWEQICFQDDLPEVLIERLKNKTYIVQERIDLATYQGAPFDLRVAVQKNGQGKWKVSAIIAKVAMKNQFLTNAHQGGKICKLDYLLEEYPTLSLERVKESINEFCIKIAEQYSTYKADFGDLGFDIAITKDGFIYFIEGNKNPGFELTLQNDKLIHEEWKTVFYRPIKYGRYLLQQE